MCSDNTFLLKQDGVSMQQLMLDAFLLPQKSLLFIFTRPKSERKTWKLGVDFTKKLTGCLHLQIVLTISSTLVDSGSSPQLFGLAFSATHYHIQCENIVGFDFGFIHFLFNCCFIDDHLVAINNMAFHLVRKHSF